MALTIHPAGSGTKRDWVADTATFFFGVLLGAVGSALLVMSLVGFVDILVHDRAVVVLIVTVGALAVLRETGIRVPVPYRTKQVPEWWRQALPMRLVALAYGLMLGFGFATPFTSSAHLATMMVLPFLDSPWLILAPLVLFASGKAAVLYVGQGASSYDEVRQRLAIGDHVSRRRKLARKAAALATTLAALTTFAYSAFSSPIT